MSRLTTNQNYCDTCDFGREKECFFDDKEKFNCKDKQIYEKLKEYEDLEEQGLLVKLPCKVGDIVYRPVPKLYRTYTESVVAEINISKEGVSFNTDKGIDWRIDTIGRTIFLTKEQAEQKLKEMEREDK